MADITGSQGEIVHVDYTIDNTGASGTQDIVLTREPDDTAVIDNYEDLTAGGYYASGDDISTYYAGSTGNYARTTTNVTEGSKAVEYTGSNGRERIVSTPGDGLPNYPEAEDTVRFLVRDADSGSFGVQPGMFIAASDSNNGLTPHIRAYDDDIRIGKISSGSVTASVASTSVTLSFNNWYWGEFDMPDSSGNVEFRLYDLDTGNTRGSKLASVTATESAYAGNQGVGVFQNAGSSGVGVDGITIKSA